MAAAMRSTDFRSVVEPILNEVFDGIYDQRKDEWKSVFREQSGIARAYHEEPVMYGFNAAPELPDGMPVTYQQGGILYVKRYQYKVFGLAFAITKILQEDGDHIRVGSIFSKHLAQALIETKETRAANVLNRAFNGSYLGGDGVALNGVAMSPATLLAVTDFVEREGAAEAVRQFQKSRETYYRQLPTFATFGRGWLRRVREVETAALGLV